MSRQHSHSSSCSSYEQGLRTLEAERSVDALAIEGVIPDWLAGSLIRTGPSLFEVGQQSYRHWFDGLAMLHAFSFAAGQVSYTNRLLRSSTFTGAHEAGKIVRSEFATDPCYSLFGRVLSWFRSDLTDNCNVNVERFADQVVAMTETRLPICFDPQTLETLGVLDYEKQSGELPKGPLATAHPHFDTTRREHYNYLIDFGRKSTYQIFSTDDVSGRQEIVAKITTDRPAYMHSFGMSERYLVLAEFPLTVNPLGLKFRRRPFIENYRWTPERRLRLHVIEKDTGRVVRRAECEALFAFHHVNAFEDGNDLCVDLIAYSDPTVIEHLYLSRLRDQQPSLSTGRLTRIRIDLSRDSDAATEQLLANQIELPRVHYERVAGRRYRYIFCAGNTQQEDPDFLNCLFKLDIETGTALEWSRPNCFPGEPVFIPRPDAQTEDAGVALSVVLDAERKKSFLLVLDAENWSELARATAPHVIPFGFHGSYFRN